MALAAPFSHIDYHLQGRTQPVAQAISGTLTLSHPRVFAPVVAADNPNEDRLWVKTFPHQATALLVNDGVTQRTAWRVNGLPAGWHAAELQRSVIDLTLGPTTTAEALWAHVLQSWEDFERAHDCPADEKLRATMALFNPFRADDRHCGALWLKGDVVYAWQRADGSWFQSSTTFPPNSADAVTRAKAIKAAMERGHVSHHPLPSAHDLTALLDVTTWGASAELPQRFSAERLRVWQKELHRIGWDATQKQRILRAQGLLPPDPTAAPTMTTARWLAPLTEVRVPKDVITLMLGSDGIEKPCRSIAEGLGLLQHRRRFDPMCLGIPPTDTGLRELFLPLLHQVDGMPQWPCHAKGFTDDEGRTHDLLDDLSAIVAKKAA